MWWPFSITKALFPVNPEQGGFLVTGVELSPKRLAVAAFDTHEASSSLSVPAGESPPGNIRSADDD